MKLIRGGGGGGGGACFSGYLMWGSFFSIYTKILLVYFTAK